MKYSVLLVLGVILFFGMSSADAQEVCGSIFYQGGFESPIADCDQPFGTPNPNASLVLNFGETIIEAGNSYPFLDRTASIGFTGTIEPGGYNFVNVDLYRMDEGSYYYQTSAAETYTFETAGTYVIVVEENIAVPVQSWTDRLMALFGSVAHAANGDLTIIEFTVIEPEDCGDFIEFEGREPITNCANPFMAGDDFPYTITIGGELVTADATLEFAIDTPVSFVVSPDDEAESPDSTKLYRHDDLDYRRTAIVDNDGGTDTVTFNATGTYTVVVTVDSGPVTWWPSIILKAHADEFENFTLTFKVINSTHEPAGTSSVLFLPGIQASRLYNDGERVWEPFGNDDIRALRMDDSGVSENPIYTEDVVDEIFGVTNIYRGFLDFLDDQVTDQVITDWATFPYDWRYDVFDIVENGTATGNSETYVFPTEVIEDLVAEHGGPVTLIAHSNGGLLAKAIMLKLEEEGKENLVDKIIFIGTPHLGTPKAIGTLLHGYDQEAVGGLVVDDGVARRVIKNLPGVYSLLPSEAYFDAAGDPLVVFDDSPATADLRDYYGFGVSNFTEFVDFLNGAEDPAGRGAVPEDAVNEPTVANSSMLDSALTNHADLLDDWSAPTGVEVYQIVGTGLPTMKAIEYRGVTETVCEDAEGDSTPSVCIETELLKPYAQLTKYGDETVASVSGSADNNSETFYLDLDALRRSPLSVERIHADLTESQQVQEITKNLLMESETINVEFITETEPNFTEVYDIEVIDSPVAIYTTDSDGNVTGLVEEDGELVKKREIPGSRYFEFGGSKYLITPSELDRTTTLTGLAYGGYTLTVSTLEAADEQLTQHLLSNASATPDMVATYTKVDGKYGHITTDLDGDGAPDSKTTLDGEVISDVEVTYDDLLAAIADLDLEERQRQVLIVKVKLMMRWAEKNRSWLLQVTENVFRKTLTLYQRKGWITAQEQQTIIEIVGNINLNDS